MTRTHTQYWSDDQVEPLATQVKALREDFADRAHWIDSEAMAAMALRICLLEHAVELLTDTAD